MKLFNRKLLQHITLGDIVSNVVTETMKLQLKHLVKTFYTKVLTTSY